MAYPFRLVRGAPYSPRRRSRPQDDFSKGWVKVPKALLADTHLSDSAFRLMLVLLAHDYGQRNGESWPSQNRLAEITGLLTRQVRRLLRDLVRAGYISIERVGRSNRYAFASGTRAVPPTPKQYPRPPSPLPGVPRN